MSRRENRDELEPLRATIHLKDQTIVSLQEQLSNLKAAKEQKDEAYRELSEKINVLTEENLELRNEIDRLKVQRPSLKSVNLISSFQKSIEKMQESLKIADSRVGYSIGNLEVSLKTNVSLDEQGEITYQLPEVGDVTSSEGLSTINFSLRPVPKVEPPPPDTVEVPNLIGLDRNVAIQILNDVNLSVGTVTERSSPTRSGLVIGQTPESYARAPVGTKVDLIVSKVNTTKVPNLIGIELENAFKLIENSSLIVGDLTEMESVSTPKTVISQSIMAGTTVSTDSKIDLVIAKPEETKVPNVLGKTLEEARSAFEAAKLRTGRVGYEASGQPPNVVIKQSPEPNTAIPSNETVDLTLSRRTSVKAPNLIGKGVREAERMLKNLGLACGSISERPSTKEEGTVIGQDPSPGTEVERGKDIDLVTATQKLEAIDGIGRRIGARLRRIRVNNVSDLVETPISSLSRTVGDAKAQKLLDSVRLIVGKENLEGIVDEEALETIILGGGIFTRESLAKVDVEELRARLSKALDEGRIKLPEGYNLTAIRIEEWVRSARG
jgi:beta-lactam-binding protein with PASTA domain